MVRTQISLEPERHRRAKARAADLGVSLARYVRDLIDRDLGGDHPRRDPSLLVAIGDSGGADVARRKDEMVGDAVVEEWRRERGG